ncbi:MAG: hypothetical protein WCO16_03640 [bacterium]|jgi:hypothetical protein
MLTTLVKRPSAREILFGIRAKGPVQNPLARLLHLAMWEIPADAHLTQEQMITLTSYAWSSWENIRTAIYYIANCCGVRIGGDPWI